MPLRSPVALIETAHSNVDLGPSPIEPSWIIETIVILEGSIVLGGEGMPARRYGGGDVIFFRKRRASQMACRGPCEEDRLLASGDAFGFGFAIRAVNKLIQLLPPRLFAGRPQSRPVHAE